jgi:hypothetical protein
MTLATNVVARGLSRAPSTRRSRALVSATLARLTFFIVYYALNVAFAADSFVMLLTFPSFLVCCYNAARIMGAHATVEDMLWLLMFVFFVIAPCQTLRFGHFENDGPVSGIFFTNAEIATAAGIIFLFLLTATVTTVLVRRLVPETEAARYQLKEHALPVLLALNVLAFASFVVLEGGMSNVLADRHSKDVSDDTSAAILGTAATALQMVACLLTCVYAKYKPHRTTTARAGVGVATAAALTLLLICQNPYNTARFYFMIAWLPIILVFMSGKLGIKIFYLSVVFGLVVAMPMLNFTTRFGASLAEAAKSVDASSVFTIPGLDVFDMLVYEVRYLELSDFFWGGKTLGLVFFFVPRSLWAGKETVLASDMGVVLADIGTAGTANLSGFVAGDFYADLGMVGVALGAVMVALLLTVFGRKRPVLVHGLDLRAFIFMASVPILVRGSLGSVIALTFIELVSLATLTRVLCRRSPSRLDRASLAPFAVARCPRSA